MIFLGDVAHPFEIKSVSNLVVWDEQKVIVNLEGALSFDVLTNRTQDCLFNHISVVEYLNELNVGAVCIANNHITDINKGIERSRKFLEEEGISCFGAGKDKAEAALPARLKDNDKEFIIFGFGWSTIQCDLVTARKSGVNPFTPEHMLMSVSKCRESNPDAVIVAMPHWNYEMELYPQPAHRQLAMAAIDAGADAVIGHHTHCVNGIELYHGKPIVYSLGNWWLPHGMFFNGKASFSDSTLMQLAFEWDGGDVMNCHWYQYNRDGHTLEYDFSEPLGRSERINRLTPFSGFGHREYIDWFKLNRVKNKGLPVYLSYNDYASNYVKDKLVFIRHPMMIFMKRMLSLMG